MAVIRVEKTTDYTVMSNYHFKEKGMSLKAKGLLSFMLSLPDDWDYSIEGLTQNLAEKETSIVSALNELKKFGYLRVVKLFPNQTASGRIEYEYIVYEKPYVEKQDTEKQDTEKQGLENLALEKQGIESQDLEIQDLENQGQLNTNIQSTNKQNTKESSTKKKDIKHKHGEYQHVLLTDEQYEKLISEFADWEDKIRNLDEYIQMTGKSYKDHYLTIKTWARNEAKKNMNTNKNKNVLPF